MTSTGTRDFLNGLRVAGRIWSSHGDKITNAAQGRNYDDERADQKLGKAAGAAATGAGGEELRPGAGSPSIMRQQSRDLVVSPSSPFIMRQASSPTSGWGDTGANGGSSSSVSAASGSIMRQNSLDFVSSTAAVVNSPPLIARQASRDMPLPDILRQHSRELASTSPTQFGNNPNATTNSNNNGFRPIGSPVGGGSNRDLSTSPVSFLVPTLPPGTTTSPTALRPGGLRAPPLRSQSSNGRENTKRRAGGKQQQRQGQSPSPSLLRQGTQETQQIVPSLPPQVLKQASKALTERDERAHGADHAAAKAVHEVKKDEEEEERSRVTFSATEKVELVHSAQASRRKSQSFGGNIFNRKNRGKSIASRKSIIAEPESMEGGGGRGGDGEGGAGGGGAVGGGGWKPGHFLSRIMRS